jgi:hypothetical protein
MSTYEEAFCSLVQATIGEYCGLTNPVARGSFMFPLCGAGSNALPDPARIVDSQTCAYWEFTAAANPFEVSISQQVLDNCCTQEAPPPSSGVLSGPPLCPATPCINGSRPLNSDVVLDILLLGHDVTCGKVQEFIQRNAIPDDSDDHGVCSLIEFAGIEKCGCPDLRDFKPCHLCKDEKSVFDPNRSGFYNIGSDATCFQTAALVSTFNEFTEVTCSVAQATIGEDCGCSNPVARAQLMSPLCGPGVAIPDPAKLINEEGDQEVTCAHMEYVAIVYRNSVVDAAIVEHCCAETNISMLQPSSSLSPSLRPSAAPHPSVLGGSGMPSFIGSLQGGGMVAMMISGGRGDRAGGMNIGMSSQRLLQTTTRVTGAASTGPGRHLFRGMV